MLVKDLDLDEAGLRGFVLLDNREFAVFLSVKVSGKDLKSRVLLPLKPTEVRRLIRFLRLCNLKHRFDNEPNISFKKAKAKKSKRLSKKVN